MGTYFRVGETRKGEYVSGVKYETTACLAYNPALSLWSDKTEN